MRRAIGYRVFLAVLLLTIIIVSVFISVTVPALKNHMASRYLSEVEAYSDVLKNKLEVLFDDFEMALVYLSKDMLYGEEKKAFLLQDFVKGQKGVESGYIFDENQEIINEYGTSHELRNYIERTYNERVFYEAFSVDYLEDGKYLVYYKTDHLGYAFIYNVAQAVETLFNNQQHGLYLINDFGEIVAKSANSEGVDMLQFEFRNELLDGYSQTYHREGFISFKPVDTFSRMRILVVMTSQAYEEAQRTFLIRLLVTAMFLFTMGCLVAWRLIGNIYQLHLRTMLDQQYDLKEFQQFQVELQRAIEWIDDVTKHYDDLNELREELVLISRNIPKEGVMREKVKKS